jgi:hypothetical protein
MNPELIPRPGVLFHLSPGVNGESWVNLDTRGVGYAIGRVTPNTDGTYRAWIGQESCGDSPDEDGAMWLCIRAHLNGSSSPAARSELRVGSGEGQRA